MRFFTANSRALACSAALPTMGTTMVVRKGIGTRSCLLASERGKQQGSKHHNTGRSAPQQQ